jgi:hypothetical protein
MFFVHAIRFLCVQHKERSSDNVKNMIIKEFKHGRGAVVPDYAYDIHTIKGRAMRRDEIHFLTDASIVIPQLEGEDIKKIYNEYLDYCKKEKTDKTAGDIQPFEFNSWQY